MKTHRYHAACADGVAVVYRYTESGDVKKITSVKLMCRCDSMHDARQISEALQAQEKASDKNGEA